VSTFVGLLEFGDIQKEVGLGVDPYPIWFDEEEGMGLFPHFFLQIIL
jgi:hypothetical protein